MDFCSQVAHSLWGYTSHDFIVNISSKYTLNNKLEEKNAVLLHLIIFTLENLGRVRRGLLGRLLNNDLK